MKKKPTTSISKYTDLSNSPSFGYSMSDFKNRQAQISMARDANKDVSYLNRYNKAEGLPLLKPHKVPEPLVKNGRPTNGSGAAGTDFYVSKRKKSRLGIPKMYE